MYAEFNPEQKIYNYINHEQKENDPITIIMLQSDWKDYNKQDYKQDK